MNTYLTGLLPRIAWVRWYQKGEISHDNKICTITEQTKPNTGLSETVWLGQHQKVPVYCKNMHK